MLLNIVNNEKRKVYVDLQCIIAFDYMYLTSHWEDESDRILIINVGSTEIRIRQEEGAAESFDKLCRVFFPDNVKPEPPYVS